MNQSSRQTRLLKQKQQEPKQPKELKDIVKEYYNQQKKEDQIIAEGMTNQLLAFFFNLFITLSYTFFVIAVAITATTGLQEKQRFLQYATNPDKLTYLVILSALAIVIYTLRGFYTTAKKLPAQYRKRINFYLDISRTVAYIVIGIFVTPFVFTEGVPSLTILSYWLFIIALALFIIRKVIKWRYYRYGNGAKNEKPWQSVLVDTGQFVLFMQKKLQDASYISKLSPVTIEYINGFSQVLETLKNSQEDVKKYLQSEQQKIMNVKNALNSFRPVQLKEQ